MDTIVGEVRPLGPGEVRGALAFLNEDPWRNIWVIRNLLDFGPYNLGYPEQGSCYVCWRDGKGQEAIQGVLFCSNLGFWRFDARSPAALFHLMKEALSDGLSPLSVTGDPEILEGTLSLFERSSSPLPPVIESEREVIMCLSGEGDRVFPVEGARIAEPGDLQEMVKLERGLQLHLLGASAPDGFLRRRIREVVEKGRAAVFPWGRHLAAKAELEVEIPGVSQLSGVFTRARYRRRGCATACCALLCGVALAEGRSVCLETQADNHAALSLYRKLGFDIHGPSLVVRLRA